MARTRFYLPVWYRDRLSPTCTIDRVRFVGNAYFPRGGAWVGVLSDGTETIDFGLRSEAQSAADYFERARSRNVGSGH